MTIVVFGASGQIGRNLLPRLTASQQPVLAISRQAQADAPGLCWLRGSLPESVPALPEDASALVCLGPLDHFSRWLQGTTLPPGARVVAMSSMSAVSKRDSPSAAERELSARLRRSEQALFDRCASLRAHALILRATLIYGGTEGSLERLAARARRWHLFPLPLGHGLRQPLHAEDLAQAVSVALERPEVTGVMPLGGGERLPVARMFARVRRELAPHSLPVPVPPWVLGLRSAQRGVAARLGEDLLADSTRAHAELALFPRPFRPAGSRQGMP